MTQRTLITLHQLTCILPDGKALYNDLNLTFAQCKTGLVGKNGIGKSTLLRLIAGEFDPTFGSIHVAGTLVYISQASDFSSTSKITVVGLLGFEQKMRALQRIYQGSLEVQDFMDLDEDWQVEERLQQQLKLFDLQYLAYDTPIHQLSGGEITRLRLTKAFFSQADVLLLDEPTNHLDNVGRKSLYRAIQNWEGGMIIASHDRTLLNFMDEIVELTTLGAFCYGGNYEHYREQKSIQASAHLQTFEDAKKSLKKSETSIQTSREKHAQKQSYGRKLRKTGCIDKMSADSKKWRSEGTQSKLSTKQVQMMKYAETKLQEAKANIEISDEIRVELPATKVPKGKLILQLEAVTFAYPSKKPIIDHFNLQLIGPKRIALSGKNGSGKTTLIRLILGQLKPITGKIYIGTESICYLDQHANLLNPELSLIENFMVLNPDIKIEEAYRSLAAFLFKNITAHKFVKQLSGGEKLRAVLACVLMTKKPPQLLILDEPTNHLDLHSILQIESPLKNYQGAMIVISHDQTFLKNIGVEEVVYAPFVG